jgi:ABC-type proline/glycine betaine transport system permease subunit
LQQSIGKPWAGEKAGRKVAPSINVEKTMKTINKTFKDTVNEVADAFLAIGRHLVRTLECMSWPSLLAMCIVVALFLTILPLAVMLFLGFMLAKVIIGLFAAKKYHQE